MRASVQSLEEQGYRETADRPEAQCLGVLTSPRSVPIQKLEPHGIEAAATCPCQCQQSHRERHTGDLKRMNWRKEHDSVSYLRITSPNPTRGFRSFVLAIFSPDTNGTAANQARACNASWFTSAARTASPFSSQLSLSVSSKRRRTSPAAS